MIVELMIGDWSGDGHGITSSKFIRCNKDMGAIKKALIAGQKIVGVDLSKIADEYEDNRLWDCDYDNLKEAGMDLGNFDFEEGDDYCNINPDRFAEIYIFLVKKGDPEIEIEDEKMRTINIGGYGLFY